MPRGESDAERNEPQRDERGESRARDRNGDRPLGACGDGERDERRAGERRADEVAGAGPSLALLGEIADQRGDRKVVRPPERRNRERERGQKPVGDAEQNEARIDRRGQRDAG